MLDVIDISRHQGYINWGIVKGNTNAAMIKIGGSDDGFYMDGQAQRNLIEARSNGLPIGMYVFLGGFHSIAEEVQHIKNMLNTLGGLKPGEPFALDWEMRRTGLDEVGYLTGIVQGLLDSGFPPPLIYMNLNYVKTQNWQNLVNRNCGLWVAAWGNNDAIPEAKEVPGSDEWPFWAMWQFSSNTNVAGIVGRVDHNQFNGDINTFRAYGLKGALTIPGTPTPLPANATVSAAQVAEYTVRAGDTLSGIASRYGRAWQELFAINRDRISNPNRIYTNQKLRVWGSAVNAPLPTATHPSPQAGKWHTVVSGENLSVIAAKYGLSSWTTLYDLNKAIIGGNPNMIRPGQQLRIP